MGGVSVILNTFRFKTLGFIKTGTANDAFLADTSGSIPSFGVASAIGISFLFNPARGGVAENFERVTNTVFPFI